MHWCALLVCLALVRCGAAMPTNASLVWSAPSNLCMDSNVPLTQTLAFAAGSNATVNAYVRLTGQLMWQFQGPVAAAKMHGLTLAEGATRVLYTTDTAGHVYALNAVTGEQIWRVATGQPCVAAAPVFYEPQYTTQNEKRLYVSCNNVYALNATTGDALFTVKLQEGASTAPLLWDGEKMYVAERNGRTVVFHPKTGATLQTLASPCGQCTANSLSYCGNYEADLLCLGVQYPPTEGAQAGKPRLVAIGRHSGNLVWSKTAAIQGPVVDDEYDSARVYAEVHTGDVVAVHTTTGKELWRTALGGTLTSHVLCHGYSQTLLAAGMNGVFKLSYAGKVLGHFPIAPNAGQISLGYALGSDDSSVDVYFTTCDASGASGTVQRVRF